MSLFAKNGIFQVVVAIMLLLAMNLTMLVHGQPTVNFGGTNVPAPTVLMVNNIVEPLAVDTKIPDFSWVVNSKMRSDSQNAYRIIISSTRKNAERDIANVWNSGKIASHNQNDIEYAGIPLQSKTEYYWKICTWNKDGKQSRWSKISRFATGMLKTSDWKGEFIGKKDYQ